MKEILTKIEYFFHMNIYGSNQTRLYERNLNENRIFFHMNIYGSNLETPGCGQWPCSISASILIPNPTQQHGQLYYC